ncbi:DNA polymerase III subunit delta [Thermodesulfatator autotrophicus]|uniref:DNA-directed DNA polymerase n=1 Tax=Thermodesulfatator autotrophicus TaxID=1795632 RepID=A0A177E964_9BACT|nr:DNA polymerase III subunit delta [Thermodesulfatator autotrophicus]OAG28455.1 hypothetical protein TH606_01765 [Thermodesulfatator autotrophicus]
MPIFKRQHFERLLKLAQEGRIAPIYLFLGNPKIAEELSLRLFNFLKKQGHHTEKVKIAEIDQLKEKVFSPFLFGRKVVYLEEAAKALSLFDQETLSKIEENKSRLSLIFFLESLEEKHPLYKYALERAVIIPLPRKKAKDLLSYEIPELLASFGKKMERQAAEALLLLVGEDLNLLTKELEKLALYTGEKPIITVADVKEVVSPPPEQASYLLSQALFQSGPEAALKILKNLIVQGIHPLVILATLVNFFKKLYLLREVLNTYPDLASIKKYQLFQERYKKIFKELFPDKEPKELKGHPYGIFVALKQAKVFSLEDFPFIFAELAKIDMALKTGSPPEEIFYSFFLKIQHKVKPPKNKAKAVSQGSL